MSDEDVFECPCSGRTTRKIISGTEDEMRAAVVAEARTWLRTPFHHQQAVKGVAADCGTFLIACFSTVKELQLSNKFLEPDWFVHSNNTYYTDEVMRNGVEFTLKQRDPKMGDIVLYRDVAHGIKGFSHGSIVLQWRPTPLVIHCFPPCVMISNPYRTAALCNKPMAFFDLLTGVARA